MWPRGKELHQGHGGLSFSCPAETCQLCAPQRIGSLSAKTLLPAKRPRRCFPHSSALAACATEAHPPSCHHQMSQVKTTRIQVETQEVQERQSRRTGSIWKVRTSLQSFEGRVRGLSYLVSGSRAPARSYRVWCRTVGQSSCGKSTTGPRQLRAEV